MSKKIIIITILIAIMLFTQFSNIVYAATIDTSKTASLTIIEYENAYGTGKDSSQNVPLSGVEVTIYKLDDANFNKTAEQIENDIINGKIKLTSQTLTTGSDGKITFKNLQLGRYLVRQTNSPANVNVKMESFLVDLPRTSEDGKSWNYDVTVEPKNITVYGDVLLTKTSNSSANLQGTTWELQVKNSSDTWEKYNYAGTLTTNSNGQISISNLPAGKYRLVETGTLEGYILDSSNTKEFEISTEKTSVKLNAINEKPTIDKQVKISEGYGKAVGAFTTDTVDWKITVDVPTIINKMNTFYVTDKIPQDLDFVANSLVVYAGESTLELGTDYTLTQSNDENGKNIKLDFVTSNLSEYHSLYFTYQTTFNSNVKYGEALTNSATLTYTNHIDVNGTSKSTYTSNPTTAEVHTGALKIRKVDAEQKPLSGAKFKISKTEDDAKNHIYIKDPSKTGKTEDDDLIAVSGEDGYLTFYGLKYGDDNISANTASSTYYITEVESPTYEENGETKHYQLLATSVEAQVNSESGKTSTSTPQIVNKKGFNLPITGTTGTISFALIGSIFIIIAIKRNKKNDKKQIEEN